MPLPDGPPGRQSPLAANQRAEDVADGGNKSIVASIADNFGNVARGALVEAMLDGEAATWLRAAMRYERARPQPGEFHGRRTTRAELRAKWVELTELANACRARARVLRPRGNVEAEVDAGLVEMGISYPSRDKVA